MTITETLPTSQMIDGSLHLIIEAIEANPPRPGSEVAVTFYLPTGTVIGNIEPCWFFDQKLLGYLQTIGVDHDHPNPGERGCSKHEFVHLAKVTVHRGSEVDQHDQIRVRLADVHSWTFGRGQMSVKDVRW